MSDLSSKDRGEPATDNAVFFSPAYLEKRRRALEQSGGPHDMDDFDPKLPAGHAYAIRTSTRLTSDFRRVHRKDAMDITPQDVVNVLNAAGLNNWVLIGTAWLRRVHVQSTRDTRR
jgi:hypothetical protein